MEKTASPVRSFINKSEILLKTDVMYLAKGSFWNILSQIIVSSSTLLLAIAFARFSSKETYGQYKYILSIANILGTFTLTGFGTAVVQAVSGGHEGTLRYAFWKNIQWSIPFFLGCLGTSIYYFVNANTSFGVAFLFIGSLSPFISSTNLYNAYLSAKKDFKRSAIYYNIIGNLFPALCIFVTIFLTQKPLMLVIVYFVSNALIGIILYKRVVDLYKPNDSVDSGALSYTKHLSFLGVLGSLADNIDQILVFHYIGAAQLAVYNFAIAIPSQVKGPLKGLSGLMFPKFVEREEKDIKAGIRNKYLLLFLASICIIVAYIFAAPYVFKFLFPKYSSSIFYSQLFSISLLWMVSIPAETYFVAKKKIKEQYIINILDASIQIVLFYLGVLWYGILGLIIAQIVTKITQGIVRMIVYEVTSKKHT
jgi:O-antigen/teichoic acid export membrane protein